MRSPFPREAPRQFHESLGRSGVWILDRKEGKERRERSMEAKPDGAAHVPLYAESWSRMGLTCWRCVVRSA
jgi:hypothetical protein